MAKRGFLLTTLTIAAIGLVLFVRGRSWKALPDGTEFRLEKVEYASQIVTYTPGVQMRAVRSSFGPIVRKVLGPQPYSSTFFSDPPGTWIVFAVKGRGSGNAMRGAEAHLILKDGRTIRLTSRGSSGNGDVYHEVFFSEGKVPIEDSAVRLTTQGVTHEFRSAK